MAYVEFEGDVRPLGPGVLTIGSAPGAGWRILGHGLEPVHLLLSVETGGRALLIGGAPGSAMRVNGVELTVPRALLSFGDRVQAGTAELRYRRMPSGPETSPDAYLRDILTNARTIAVVGASPRPHRPSHGVMRFLQRHGYRAIPVNPFAAGSEILGERVYASLADIAEPVDMVDIFRRSEAAGAVVDEAIAIGAKAVWMQLDVRDDGAAARAEAKGLKVVMDRCPAIEIPRLALGAR